MSADYLIASLPLLRFDTPPGITAETFLDACRAQLRPTDAAAAAALLADSPCEHPFVAAWHDKETLLRNAVARERARRTHEDAARWLRPAHGCDTRIESDVEDAFQEPDPLAKTRSLDRIRWRLAEELAGVDPLSTRVVLAYALHLAILLRWTRYNETRGREAFDALTAIPITLENGGG